MEGIFFCQINLADCDPITGLQDPQNSIVSRCVLLAELPPCEIHHLKSDSSSREEDTQHIVKGVSSEEPPAPEDIAPEHS